MPLKKAHKVGLIEVEALSRLNYPGEKISGNVLKGIDSVGYWDAIRDQDWGLGWHRNEGIEITFQETGQNSFSLKNASYTLLPDDFTITRPWQLHKVGNPNITIGKLHWLIIDVNVRKPHQDWEWPGWIILSDKDITTLTMMLRQNENPVWRGNKTIRKCFLELGNAIRTDEGGSNESTIKIMINELLLKLMAFFKEGKIELNELLTDKFRSIDLFLEELDIRKCWTLESMAQACGMGVTAFTYYFKKRTNVTPMRYLMNKKLREGAELLVSSSKSVKEIAYELEFESPQYFSKVFYKHYNTPPLEYRGNLRNRSIARKGV